MHHFERVVAFDTETCLIEPGLQSPPLVCVQFQIIEERGVRGPCVLHHSEKALRHVLMDWFVNEKTVIVGHNTAYDTCVLAAWCPGLLPYIWQTYKAKRITDTLIREQLINNAKGELKGRFDSNGKFWKNGYALSNLTRYRLKYDLDKPSMLLGADGSALPDPSHVRLRYSELIDSPDVAQWPEAFRVYAEKDAEATMGVFLHQNEQMQGETIPDEFEQAHSDFCKKLMSAWGLRTTAEGVARLKEKTFIAHRQCLEELVEAGLVRKDGTRNIAAAQKLLVQSCALSGTPVPMTDPSAKFPEGQPSLSADILEDIEDPILQVYGEYGALNAVISKDIPMLETGIDKPIHTRMGLAASGRTTSSKPNIQNLRTLEGIREAFIPRDGMLFLATDYIGLELHTLAEVCHVLLGKSTLGDALNGGLDPHTEMAARILGRTYDEALDLKKLDTPEHRPFYYARQTGKAANFGFPGGLGKATFIHAARAQYGIVLTEGEAMTLKAQYFAAWPEIPEYFQLIKDQDGYAGIQLRQIYSGRIRGGMTFTAACNTLFQGLGADAAQAGLRRVTEACYVDRASILFGCRPVAFVHDEVITEIPDDELAHERAQEHARLMRAGADEYLMHCPSREETVLMRRWTKSAKPTFKEGRLVPYGD